MSGKEIGDPLEQAAQTGKIGGKAHPPANESSNAARLQSGNTALPQSSMTAKRLNLPAVKQQRGNAARQQSRNAANTDGRDKATFYLTPAQSEKLDTLALEYRKRTGRRVNRNDIVRFLIDQARLETLLSEW